MLGIPDVTVLSRRICDLMAGKEAAANAITFEGYVHFASIIINGILDDKAELIIYLAGGKNHEPTVEECQQVWFY